MSVTLRLPMGMVAQFYQITSEQLAEFLRRPAAAYDYVQRPFFDNPASVEWAENALVQMRTIANRFPAFRSQINRVAGQLNNKLHPVKGPLVKSKSELERKDFSLEKDWHVLHYALNGTHDGGIGPLADAILGGSEIPDVEGVTSYGAGNSSPLRYLATAQVQSIAAALLEVDPSQLLSKLDFEGALKKKIYLSHTLDDLANWQYLPDLFQNFRNFYTDAAESGNCMLLSVV